ncbi:hypothetical protein HYV83_00745 [Candidatus Woesearchaeota archaeon]|nr:hypothetical protein [Candidatus Woesearchaeota archaeon]
MPDGQKSRSGTAVLSFILSLSFWMPLLNYFICLGAVYFGFKALMDIRDANGKRPGRFFALSGIVLGLVPYYFGIINLLSNVLHVSKTLLANAIIFVPTTMLLLLFLVMKRYRLL